MRPRKNPILIMLLGLLLFAFAVAIAQTPAQGDQNKKSEACCSMDSCCCNGGSCPMKAEGAANAEAKDGCCGGACCNGDSCEMKMKDGAKNHSEHQGGCSCGDSCDMKAKHDTNDPAARGACCKMKHKDMKNKAKQKAA